MSEELNSAPGRATLSQVARRAGVSATTASLVLGGKARHHRISEETFQRVKQAAAELDYAPNLLVRSLQQKRTGVLSFFSAFRNREPNDRYMDTLSTAIQRAGGRHGYDILVHCDFSRTPEETYHFLNGGRSDGLIFFAPQSSDPLLPLLRQSRLPVVLLNAVDEEGTLSSVRDDVQAGMQQVADALIQNGHRRIGVFTETEEHNPDAVERVHLLRTFLSHSGIEIPDDRIVVYPRGTRKALALLMERPNPPTAIFCWSDRIAYSILEECDTLGIVVPDQLTIIGYDGLPWPAATRHQAASVQVNLDRMADMAVQLLDSCIRLPQPRIARHTLPVNLSAGTTLGPVT